ncbi:alpha/beta hydrolase [Patescibacteria group bacterium]|nr:alpha/beta hydrolase [Patescibacteria group bacterium]MBU1890095.1 alpha/beta hydrolase [Patescibacteria group bacterium]
MPKRKTQILYIHGGMTFVNKKDYFSFIKNREVSIDKKIAWNGEYLDKKLGSKFHIIRPRMPLQDNAKYSDWAIHFERFFPKLNNNLILIGESLGGIFLVKYLSENKFPKKILSAYLVCPPYDNTLAGEDLAGGFEPKPDLSLLEKNSKKLTLLFSKNDNVVPISHAKKYSAKLKNANIKIYKHIHGHFQIPAFPEIIEMIKSDIKRK